MKNNTTAILFSIAIVVAAYFLGSSYAEKFKQNNNISVKGLGSKDFVSDLIVWGSSFSSFNTDLKQAYTYLGAQKSTVKNYLLQKGIKENEIVFKSVNPHKKTKALYSKEGKYLGEDFLGYNLQQDVIIESKNVEQVERISREVSELLQQNINLYSKAPRYYYTKLAELKLEMISSATKDAQERAETIAENSGSALGNLMKASMGIFQITGQNSNEEYSWGGTFNTSSKKKTANITMELVYTVD